LTMERFESSAGDYILGNQNLLSNSVPMKKSQMNEPYVLPFEDLSKR
jgi:hypothetical protein